MIHQLLEDLKPEFSVSDLSDVEAYILFNDRFKEEISRGLKESLKNNPVLNQLLSKLNLSSPKMQDEQSLQLQKEAVLSNNWSSYTNHLL